MSDSGPLLAPGLIVADTYEIDRLLGRGGMGEVWLARHRRVAGKLVAIKILHVQGEVTNEVLSRFHREAEIAARFEHPNIAQVTDFNTLPTGQPFLVMEYLKGQSLAQRIKAGQLPLAQIHSIIRQIGSALQTAHVAGVVHRDLKPENIFLVPTALGDQVKVLDFGISKMPDSKSFQTTDSVLLGTPLYMSPEQATGNNSNLTNQSDIFSLGSICYELLTGEAPFSSDNIARVVFRIAYEQHNSLAQVRPDLPPNIIEAVDHALQKDPALRTATVDDFVAEFTGVPLATVVATETSGVYTPGMKVSESLGSRATSQREIPAYVPSSASSSAVAKSAKQATPAVKSKPVVPAVPVAPPPAEAKAEPKVVSGKVMAVALVSVAVALSVGVISLRLYWQSLPVPDAGVVAQVDAGASVVATVTTVVDAGEAAEPAASLDAGVQVALALDAGAKVAAVHVEVAETPPTANDLRLLALYKELTASEDWQALENKRAQAFTITSKKVRAEALALVIHALCVRSANNYLMPSIEEFNRVATAGQRRALREQCIAVYPSAKDLGW